MLNEASRGEAYPSGSLFYPQNRPVCEEKCCAVNLGKKWLRWMVPATVLVIGAFVFLFGLGWRAELDVHSGRERHVTLILGVPVITGSPRDTELSEWLGAPISEPDWIEVAGEHVEPFARVCTSWCYHGILHHLHELEFLGFDGKQKHAYAVLLLNELQASEGVCVVSRKCHEVGEQLVLGQFQWPREPDPFSKLMDFWTQNSRAQVAPSDGDKP